MMTFIPPPVPAQLGDLPPGGIALTEANDLVRFLEAHNISRGDGVTAAVLDTGCFVDHLDFQPNGDRVAIKVNCTANGGADDVTDASGHGTHVTGILAADGPHTGVAPGCRIVPVKILNGTPGADTSADIARGIERGLNWVLENADDHGISVVCLSVGDDKNHNDDSTFANNTIAQAVLALAARNIPVVAASGNLYGVFAKTVAAEGMCFPAILRQTVSVGAVYAQACDDALGRPCSLGPEYGNPSTLSSKPDQLAIYTQRMARPAGDVCGTDIFAPGSWVKATGTDGDTSSSTVLQGTSQAAPITAGVIALLQSLHKQLQGEVRPPIDLLKRILQESAVTVRDNSLVTNLQVTNKKFRRVDALAAVEQMQQELSGS
jgi:subtilisin family serine protease